ncbi:unnamed protein product [Triticum turgidum subsp. durum]|uniref:Uncharacterized protein n=1 Tax=Triticum turgidum subsp. durum TaxID=4567 RepID=A0A9R0QJF7_TRITD|nr:unnamed protein product [Triticum turgidum subsp. durum]
MNPTKNSGRGGKFDIPSNNPHGNRVERIQKNIDTIGSRSAHGTTTTHPARQLPRTTHSRRCARPPPAPPHRPADLASNRASPASPIAQPPTGELHHHGTGMPPPPPSQAGPRLDDEALAFSGSTRADEAARDHRPDLGGHAQVAEAMDVRIEPKPTQGSDTGLAARSGDAAPNRHPWRPLVVPHRQGGCCPGPRQPPRLRTVGRLGQAVRGLDRGG